MGQLWYPFAPIPRSTATMVTIYGIKNCDTVRKARKWLESHGVSHHFHDLRSDGLEAELLEKWLCNTDWQTLLNRRGTTWRELDSAVQANVSASNVAQLLLENPAMIKRPVLETPTSLEIGFNENHYKKIFHLD